MGGIQVSSMKVVIIVVERHPADHLIGPFLVYCSKLENNTNFEKEKSVIVVERHPA